MRKIFTGWTFRRLIYLLIGVFIIIQSVWEGQWFGVLAGGYFASMGLFAFGCAGGNCYKEDYYVPKQSISTKTTGSK